MKLHKLILITLLQHVQWRYLPRQQFMRRKGAYVAAMLAPIAATKQLQHVQWRYLFMRRNFSTKLLLLLDKTTVYDFPECSKLQYFCCCYVGSNCQFLITLNDASTFPECAMALFVCEKLLLLLCWLQQFMRNFCCCQYFSRMCNGVICLCIYCNMHKMMLQHHFY